MRTDVTQVGPMGMVIADMQPDDPGTWLFHGHLSGANKRGAVRAVCHGGAQSAFHSRCSHSGLHLAS
jgi:manganese oxidase